MQSFTSLDFYSQGTKVAGPWYYNVMRKDCSFDCIWEDFLRALEDIYNYYKNENQEELDRLFNDALNFLQGKDVKVGKATQIGFPQGGQLAGIPQIMDTIELLFRAWSDDELQAGPYGVKPANFFTDLGERYYKEGDNYIYDHWYRIPLNTLPVGTYTVEHSCTDRGWYFDIAVCSVLAITITPMRRPRLTWPDPTSLMASLPEAEKARRIQEKGPRPISVHSLSLEEVVKIVSPRKREVH